MSIHRKNHKDFKQWGIEYLEHLLLLGEKKKKKKKKKKKIKEKFIYKKKPVQHLTLTN